MYPILAIADEVPEEINIVPIYMRIIERQSAIEYHVVECEIPALDELVKISVGRRASKKQKQGRVQIVWEGTVQMIGISDPNQSKDESRKSEGKEYSKVPIAN